MSTRTGQQKGEFFLCVTDCNIQILFLLSWHTKAIFIKALKVKKMDLRKELQTVVRQHIVFFEK